MFSPQRLSSQLNENLTNYKLINTFQKINKLFLNELVEVVTSLSMSALKLFIVYKLTALTDELLHNFTRRFVKKLYFDEPLRFISRTNLLSCGLSDSNEIMMMIGDYNFVLEEDLNFVYSRLNYFKKYKKFTNLIIVLLFVMIKLGGVTSDHSRTEKIHIVYMNKQNYEKTQNIFKIRYSFEIIETL
ncbi:hypothetical protein BpHYR1_028735 [Brachionus plicatilis]|uniref:Uncharacterized protein n=1 Tax=Brachionus plicatilis TaxID=10195 RepID=A0A3M7RGT0_BRAPC|nr:hypothetical protein BpHYR1_028735 [Brachionus plicatilis]